MFVEDEPLRGHAPRSVVVSERSHSCRAEFRFPRGSMGLVAAPSCQSTACSPLTSYRSEPPRNEDRSHKNDRRSIDSDP